MKSPVPPLNPDATAKSPYETADPKFPINKTGRRQMRSDNRPQAGAKRNCMTENEAMITPIM